MSLVHADGVSLWDIPCLTTDGYAEEPDTKEPLLVVAYPPDSEPSENVEDPDESHFSGLCDWYTGSRQPLCLDYQHLHRPEKVYSFLLEVGFSTRLQQHTLSLNSFPETTLPEICFSTEALPSRVVGGRQVRLFETDYGVACQSVQEIDGFTEDVSLELDLVQKSSELSAEIQTFCPFSGRACFYPMPSQSSVEVHVLDFFTLPM